MKKRIKTFVLFSLLGSLLLIPKFLDKENHFVEVNAGITSSEVRIPVVRPTFWESDGAYQVLRIAPTANDLTNNVVANITYITIADYNADSYYKKDGGFNEYDTNGIIWYDFDINFVDSNKYFDLARLSSTDVNDASVWNKTGATILNSSVLHKVWRIWGNGNGISMPSGGNAESRNVSNETINKLLYGYLTCSSSTYNGYGAFGTLNTNFNLSGRVYGNDDKVYDFVDTTHYDGGRFDGEGVGFQYVPTADKVTALDYRYSSIPENLNYTNNDNNSITATIIIGTIGITTLAGYYFITKKSKVIA